MQNWQVKFYVHPASHLSYPSFDDCKSWPLCFAADDKTQGRGRFSNRRDWCLSVSVPQSWVSLPNKWTSKTWNLLRGRFCPHQQRSVRKGPTRWSECCPGRESRRRESRQVIFHSLSGQQSN